MAFRASRLELDVGEIELPSPTDGFPSFVDGAQCETDGAPELHRWDSERHPIAFRMPSMVFRASWMGRYVREMELLSSIDGTPKAIHHTPNPIDGTPSFVREARCETGGAPSAIDRAPGPIAGLRGRCARLNVGPEGARQAFATFWRAMTAFPSPRVRGEGARRADEGRARWSGTRDVSSRPPLATVRARCTSPLRSPLTRLRHPLPARGERRTSAGKDLLRA